MIHSFNTSSTFYPYNANMITVPALPIVADNMRFPGGTFAKDYRLDKDYPFFNPDPSARDMLYAKYKGFNWKNNYIWPFIKGITVDLTKAASVQLVIGMSNDYINPVRAELIANYQKLDSINTYEQFLASDFSISWKAIVKDKVDMYKAFVNNDVRVNAIELNNESYMDMGNDALNFMGKYDRLIWCRKNNTALSLEIYGKLAAMYVRIFKAFDPELKFFLPISEDIDGGFKQWNRYFLKAGYVDGFAIHPYVKKIGTSDPAVAYKAARAYYDNFNDYFLKTILPLASGKLFTFSEWSSSENNPCLQGTTADGELYKYRVAQMEACPGVFGDHYHAYSNGMAKSCAILMNGATKAGKEVIGPIGQAFLSLKK